MGKVAKEQNRPPNVVIARTAYMVRVMCAHMRSKYRRQRSSEDLDDVMKQIRGSRSSSRSPFVHFRKSDDEDDDDNAEDEELVVSTYWDPYLRSAFQLMSSGRLNKPLWYEPGPKGFGLAMFEDNVTFEIEVPNLFVKDGAVHEVPLAATRPPQKRKDVVRRPAASKQNRKCVQA